MNISELPAHQLFADRGPMTDFERIVLIAAIIPVVLGCLCVDYARARRWKPARTSALLGLVFTLPALYLYCLGVPSADSLVLRLSLPHQLAMALRWAMGTMLFGSAVACTVTLILAVVRLARPRAEDD